MRSRNDVTEKHKCIEQKVVALLPIFKEKKHIYDPISSIYATKRPLDLLLSDDGEVTHCYGRLQVGY